MANYLKMIFSLIGWSVLVSCISSERLQKRSSFNSYSPYKSISTQGYSGGSNYGSSHGSGYNQNQNQNQNSGGYHSQNSHQSNHQVSCHGLREGTLIGDINSNCRKFFTCQNNYPLSLYCPPGKIFDSKFGACSYEHKTHCNYHPVEPLIRVATAAPVPRTRSTLTTPTTRLTTFM
ncbi:hypothetical protein GQR58_007158 [Nymphon striatum]|nr:hypothetical protein GQR58_007158 [Nymphon striatum]